MSLRARKAKVGRDEARIREYKRGKDYNVYDDKEALTKVALMVAFAVLCLFGGYREYNKVKARGLRRLGASHATSFIGAEEPGTSDGFTSLLTAEEDASLEYHHPDNTRYHLIFSTDCSPYQHWQSYLVYYTAMKVKQPGHVTRIASGCQDEEAAAMQEWFATNVQGMSQRFHLHMTPYFSGVKDDKGESVGDYKFFNKPFGLRHWMENAEHMSRHQRDDIVILIDPDMPLLRPIVGDFSSERETVISPRRLKHKLGDHVDHGLPFAQTYGLGAQWERFDLDKIAGADSPTKLVSKEDGALFYPAGPPYLATVQDMYNIAVKWTEFAPRVYEQYPHLLAEMYAFCIAAAHLGLKHQLVDSLMVSNTEATGEGWPLIDQIPQNEVCDFAKSPDHSTYALPSVVHLCQRYCVGDAWFFGKRKVPANIYECSTPLFVEPPSNVAQMYDYKWPPNAKTKTELKPAILKREAFMVCFLTHLVNEAATFFKQQSCSETANLERTQEFVKLFKRQHS